MCKMHGLTSKSNRAKTDVVDHIFVVVMFFCSYVVKCVLLLSRLEKIAYKRLLAMPSVLLTAIAVPVVVAVMSAAVSLSATVTIALAAVAAFGKTNSTTSNPPSLFAHWRQYNNNLLLLDG